MRTSLRLATVAAALTLAVTGIACSDDDPEAVRSGSDGSTSTTTGGSGSTTTTTPKPDAGQLPADQVVFQASTAGGFVPAMVVVSHVPEVTVYGDGRVFVTDPNPTSWSQPTAVRVGQADTATFDGFVSGLDPAVLDADFGQPPITDMPDTVVRMHTTGEEATGSIYALSYESSTGMGPTDLGMTPAQVEARQKLQDLIEQARDLAPTTKPWIPDRVRVVELDGGGGVVDPGPASLPPWPGPALSPLLTPRATEGIVLACGEVSGTEAAALYEAAGENQIAVWKVDGRPRTLVVVAVLPGEDACASA
jgi:hypothetical protein